MEAGMSAYDLWVRLKPAATRGLDLFQLMQRGEDAIGQRLVGKWPEPLGGLHLWRIGWQEHHLDALRQRQLSTAMPARPIKDQHDLFVRPCSHFLRKRSQGAGEDLNSDRRQQQPARAPALRMH